MPVPFNERSILSSTSSKLLHDLQALIEDLPAEHPLLKAARALEIRLRKTEIEQELARQYATEQSRLQTLQKDVESAQEAVRSAQKDLESLNQQIEQAKQTRASFDDLEGLIQKRLAPLREEPLRLLAELQLSTALPPTLFQPFIGLSTDNTRSIENSSIHQQDCFFGGDSTTITHIDRTLWRNAEKQCGTKSKSAKNMYCRFTCWPDPCG